MNSPLRLTIYRGALIGMLVLFLSAFPRFTPAAETPSANERVAVRSRDRELFARGRFVFQKNCVPCHGRFGEGNGELVKDWDVLPRNFRLATFKYRSTPYGSLPTDEDLKRTIRRGISGSAMPSFGQLRDEELEAVIRYIKFLSPAWKDEQLHAEPIDLPPRPAWFSSAKQVGEKAAPGRVLFRDNCSACHGIDGAGDGFAAAELKDSQGNAIKPADLRKPLRSGPEPEDAYRTIMTGINGTPMPGFAGALKPEQVWQLAAFLKGLQTANP